MAKAKKKSVRRKPPRRPAGGRGKAAAPQLPSPAPEVRGLEPEIAGRRPVQEHSVVFGVSHSQFNLSGGGGGDIEWTDEEFADRLSRDPDPQFPILAVGTVDYSAEVTLRLVVGQPCPAEELALWRHVVEASLVLNEGVLVVSSIPADDVLRIEVPPGSYRLCILYHCHDHRQGDTRPGNPETYKVYMWPAEFAPPKVMKRENSGS